MKQLERKIKQKTRRRKERKTERKIPDRQIRGSGIYSRSERRKKQRNFLILSLAFLIFFTLLFRKTASDLDDTASTVTGSFQAALTDKADTLNPEDAEDIPDRQEEQSEPVMNQKSDEEKVKTRSQELAGERNRLEKEMEKNRNQIEALNDIASKLVIRKQETKAALCLAKAENLKKQNMRCSDRIGQIQNEQDSLLNQLIRISEERSGNENPYLSVSDQIPDAKPDSSGNENSSGKNGYTESSESSTQNETEEPVQGMEESALLQNTSQLQKWDHQLKQKRENDSPGMKESEERPEASGGVDGSAADQDLFSKACPAAWDFSFAGSSKSLMLPAAGTVSAGTWAYPGGGMHLGMDLALPMFTPLKAPADGIVLYANNPVSSDCGYLGNMCGWPYGGGNTIAMLCVTEEQIYGVTLCHLSREIQVRAGQTVHQGDLLAFSGNSGNSTGPHTHIEVFEIHVSLEQAAAAFRNGGADFAFGCGWSTPGTCSDVACRIRPESVF